jgi:hypothetical protein
MSKLHGPIKLKLCLISIPLEYNKSNLHFYLHRCYRVKGNIISSKTERYKSISFIFKIHKLKKVTVYTGFQM